MEKKKKNHNSGKLHSCASGDRSTVFIETTEPTSVCGDITLYLHDSTKTSICSGRSWNMLAWGRLPGRGAGAGGQGEGSLPRFLENRVFSSHAVK